LEAHATIAEAKAKDAVSEAKLKAATKAATEMEEQLHHISKQVLYKHTENKEYARW
jgi:hypothetical protein